MQDEAKYKVKVADRIAAKCSSCRDYVKKKRRQDAEDTAAKNEVIEIGSTRLDTSPERKVA